MKNISLVEALIGAAAIIIIPASAAAESPQLSVDCVSINSAIARAPTEEMSGWLSSFSSKYNPETKFTIGAHGSMNRVFHPSGRLLHPIEIAILIRSSNAFTGEKVNRVELGISGTEDANKQSYASRVAKALGTNVEGCAGIAYYFSRGVYLCATAPESKGQISTRILPVGFVPEQFSMFMMFCVNPDTSPDPRQLISSQAVYGLFPEEYDELVSESVTEADAAFRLYQYYWIARNDKDGALDWLKAAARLGSKTAQYNLAYEKFESGDLEKVSEAKLIAEKLVSEVGNFPDLRKFYDLKVSK